MTGYAYGLGRRKTATARVRLEDGTGQITVNRQAADVYFDGNKSLINRLNAPFVAADLSANKYRLSVHVMGGGHSAQADAIVLALAKSLVTLDENLKATLRRAGLLGRDPREKERKKFGLRGARKRRQFAKR